MLKLVSSCRSQKVPPMRLFNRYAPLTCLIAMQSALLGGCQTAPDASQTRVSDTQTIGIDTPGVAGAQCVLTSATVGRLTLVTPAKIEVDRSPEIIVVRCAKRCYLDASALISSEGQRLSSGAVVYSYAEETRVMLAPAASCDAPAAKKGRASPL